MIARIDSVVHFEEGWRVIYSKDLDGELPCSGYFYWHCKPTFKVGDKISVSFRKVKK